ncbi:Leucine-rich repeat-containing protein 15 [Holothuria leucospilota]|uniref:Leucine-rich repeat-containing protein 15 n=1 Tax=Holothuria leucospilota TaxID=206669 RepID=A0A9Q1CRC6_HOLLE|nr:Leucine-rich repeat-containing protein 15 [Holothuria leucospilota]
MLHNAVLFISLVSRILISHQACESHPDFYDECENPFPSGCCTLGTAFICNGANLTDVNHFADEIPQTCTSLTVANTNGSFINNGDWKFLSNLTNLEELSFFSQKMSHLWDLKPFYLKDLVKLKVLTLAYGDLHKFPVEKFTNLMSLMYLNLRCNKFQSIGEGNWNFSSLNTLVLTENRITQVTSEQFRNLDNLSTLDLSHNRIYFFSLKVLDSMPNLKHVKLSFNRLTHVSDYRLQHVNVKTFTLNSNLFASLEPFVFNGLKSLQNIDYRNNSIKEPPMINSQNSVPSALRLSLQFNVIEILSPQFFDNFPHLKNINVADNRIRHIEEDAFRSVPNLTVINMRINEIDTIPRQLFQHLGNLVIVELQFNRIQVLDVHVLTPLPRYVKIYIHDNPIVCDCQVIPLAKWLSLSATPLNNFPTCQSPEDLQNQNIYYAKLPQDCPHSTQKPVTTSIIPTSYPETHTNHYILGLVIGALTLVMFISLIYFSIGL